MCAEHVLIVSNKKSPVVPSYPIGSNTSAQIPPFSVLMLPSPISLTLKKSHETSQEGPASKHVSILLMLLLLIELAFEFNLC